MAQFVKYFGALAFLVMTSCNHPQVKSGENSNSATQKADTSIASQNVLHDIAGSAYLKRATAYFIVSGYDTSDFKVVFAEEKENGLVGISIHYDQINRKGKSFKKRMDELKLILPKAKAEYNFDSLRNISVGRLVSTGDLAIKISREYNNKFDENYSTEDYNLISGFLLESTLAAEFNEILNPYHLYVSHISIEKAFFTSKKELFWASKIETDSLEIPDKILDCITWIRLEKAN
jgi:hypothetical protein